MMPSFRWLWRAQLVKVVDGDTLDLLIDRGFRATQVERIRLLGVNTPEVVGATKEAGLTSKRFVEEWVMPDRYDMEDAPWPLLIETHQPTEHDAFGRWLADVWRVRDGQHLGQELLKAGLATLWSTL